MDLEVNLKLRGDLAICLSLVNKGVEAVVKSSNGSKSWRGLMFDLNFERLLWMVKFPSLLSRQLFVDYETFELRICKGLLGSGSSCCCRNSKVVDCQENRNQHIQPEENSLTERMGNNEFLEMNQNKAQLLAEKIKKSMGKGVFDKEDIVELSKIKPFQCTTPYSIVTILLENIDKSSIWNNGFYKESSDKVVRIIRKFLYFYLLQNKGAPVFDQSDQDQFKTKINKALKLIESREKILPRVSTSLELSIIGILISEARTSNSTLEDLGGQCLEIVAALSAAKNFDPVPLIKKLKNIISSSIEKLRGNYVKYLVIFDAYENIKVKSDKGKEEIEEILKAEYDKLKILKLEHKIILLDYTIESVANEYVHDKFISDRIFSVIESLFQENEWKIRVKCVEVLKILKVYKNSEISKRAKILLISKKNDERDNRVLISFNSNEHTGYYQSDQRLVKNYNYNRVFCAMILRKEELEKIHKKFEETNFIFLYGKSGSGTTFLLFQYCEIFSSEYTMIYQINPGSIKYIIQDLNESLDLLKKSGEKDIKQRLKSFKEEKILLCFDNVHEYIINKLYINQGNIRYLLISKNPQSINRFDIGILADQQVKIFLRDNIDESSVNDEEINNLVRKSQGFPMKIRLILIGIKNGLSIRQILDSKLEKEEDVSEIIQEAKKKFEVESQFCLEILGSCYPKNIPEKVIQEIIKEKHSPEAWYHAKADMVNKQIVNYEPEKKIWNLENKIFDAISKKNDDESRNTLLDYYARKFNIDENIKQDQDQVEHQKNLIVQVEHCMKDHPITNEGEFNSCVNLAMGYKYILEDLKKLEEMIKKIDYFLHQNSVIKIKKEINEKLDKLWRDPKILETLDSIEIIEEKPSEKSSEISPDYIKIAEDFETQGLSTIAKTNYKKVLECIQNSSVKTELNVPTLYKIGEYLLNEKDLEQAEKSFMECILILEKNNPDSEILPDIFYKLGEIKKSQNNLESAQNFYEKSLKFEPKSTSKLLKISKTLGDIYFEKEDFENSMKYYKHCLKVQSNVNGEEFPEYVDALHGISLIHLKNQKFEESEKYFMKCLEIEKKTLHQDHPNLISTCNDLGNIFFQKKEFEKAEKIFIKCLASLNISLPYMHSDITVISNNLVTLLIETGRLPEAQEYLEKFILVEKKRNPINGNHLITLYNNLGSLFLKQKDYIKVDEVYNECISIIRQYPIKPSVKEKFFENAIDLYKIMKETSKLEKTMKEYEELKQQSLVTPDKI